MISRNIVANLVGGCLTVVLTLAAVPIQAGLLGVECFGLLAFMASLQNIATILDLGLGVTAIREIAADHSPGHRASHLLIRTLVTAYVAIGMVLGITLFTASPWIAGHGINLGTLEPGKAMLAIQILALTLVVRWPTAILYSVVSGLQRLDIGNALRLFATGLRLGGGLVILLAWPDLHAFMLWQLAAGLVELMCAALACRRLLPGLSPLPCLAREVVARVWRFSVVVNLLSIQSLLLTQVDRLLLGRIGSVEELGYYSVAYSLALGISAIQGFITTAMLPAFSATAAPEQRADRVKRFWKASQVLLYLTTLPSALLIAFSGDLLAVVFAPAVVERSSGILAVLGLGFLVSVIPSMPFTLAMSSGHERLPLMINFAVLGIYLPALWLLIGAHGGMGAAYAWLGLNAFYVLTLLPLILRQVLGIGPWPWLARNVLPFLVLGALVFTCARLLVDMQGWHRQISGLMLAGAASVIYLAGGFACLEPEIRHASRDMLKKFLGLQPGAKDLSP